MIVLKQTFEVADYQRITFPKGAKLLTVQVQHGQPRIWAACDEKQTELEHRVLRVMGTGHTSPECREYIGTFQLLEGDLVFHIFEV